MLRVPISVVLDPIKLTSLTVKIADIPWLERWPMEIRLRFPKAGKALD